ncbi:hypothetical protein LWI29_008252 [Acer saccharum]|uniref:RING-type domain-containing protein n=1 Tax=Acer saccharum TaxID=4024 RepID=A0AA39VM62_ACESA|nr:hypothetical protein LWI29_008252 [Acer saccharum]
MGVSKKKVTIAHDGDGATFINIVHKYRCSCGHVRGTYSNDCQLLPQNPEAKFKELQRFINEVIPTYKFEKNVRAFVCGWIVSHATVSNVFPFDCPSNSTCTTCNSIIFRALESDLLIRYLHDLRREDDHTCSICLREFEDGEDIRILPKCKHQFHIDCIDSWLYSHSTCPLCRTNTPINHTTSNVFFSLDLNL